MLSYGEIRKVGNLVVNLVGFASLIFYPTKLSRYTVIEFMKRTCNIAIHLFVLALHNFLR